jgi:hypothetical protein
VYRDVLLRRWRNLLGRTMWQSPAHNSEGNRYLVIGFGLRPATALGQVPEHGDLIAYGPLLSDDGSSWLGTAALLRAEDRVAARMILAEETYAHVEVHNWQPGGRPS